MSDSSSSSSSSSRAGTKHNSFLRALTLLLAAGMVSLFLVLLVGMGNTAHADTTSTVNSNADPDDIACTSDSRSAKCST